MNTNNCNDNEINSNNIKQMKNEKTKTLEEGEKRESKIPEEAEEG